MTDATVSGKGFVGAMLKNTEQRYGLISKAIHWSIGLLIIGLIWLGWYMVDLTYFDRWYNESLSLHKSFGMLVLGLVIFKFGWMAYSRSPRLAAGLANWQRIAATATHHTLLLMMVLLPVTGYVISTSAGHEVSLFDLLEIPAVLPKNDTIRDIAVQLHFYLAYGTAVLVAGHILAALKHQFIDRDGTLMRMIWK